MSGTIRVALFAVALLLVSASGARAQAVDWKPPSRQMPPMPTRADLSGDWMSARSAWFQGVDRVSGVSASSLRAAGEPRSGSDVLQIARFMNGPIPAVVWSDRNGDDRADMIEIFKSGGVIVQLLDVDYDGSANVLRIYDASGALVREERM